jgi:cell division protein ZapA (FtsZ GTPase activity inhibitor)
MLITAIKMTDDYFDLYKKKKNTKNDFEKLSIKFKELRSLAINYKDDKEKEIGKLKDELNRFKEMVEESKTSYEEILDKATKSIEQFIENAEPDQKKNIQ